MRMARLMKLKRHDYSAVMPEHILKKLPTGDDWEASHIRGANDESIPDVHNDVIHGVKHEAAQE